MSAQGQIPHANVSTHNCFAKSSGISAFLEKFNKLCLFSRNMSLENCHDLFVENGFSYTGMLVSASSALKK
jgi:hypothetical protein